VNQRTATPEDAHRGTIAPLPADADEAAADRELADAERAVALGTASDEQRARVAATAEARTHEERRRQWMANAEQLRSAGER
jgi:hypothetical protein